ncbi:MAG TPA: caspase family protein, partial [Thermotogota bacterium]|nr:caspase family protein [Thermotogota bacterium]
MEKFSRFGKRAFWLLILTVLFLVSCSPEQILEVLPGIPQSLFPGNAGTNVGRYGLTLNWNSSNATSFDLYFGTSAAPPLKAQNLTSSEYSLNPSELVSGQLYYWKIVAKNLLGQTAGSIWSFRLSFAPNAPSNPSPADQQTVGSTSPTLSWQCSDPDGDSLTYALYWGQNPTPSNKIEGLTSPTVTLTGLLSSTRYYWKVEAVDTKGNATQGPTWSFFTPDSGGGGTGLFRALTVGVSNYSGGGDLDAPPYDSADLNVTLSHLNEGYQTQMLTGYVTKNQILTALDDFAGSAGTSADDVFLFHYSGHGFYASGQSFLYLSDDSDLSVTELRNALAPINGTKIVVIDACESGDFVDLSYPRWIDASLSPQERAALFTQNVISVFEQPVPGPKAFNTPVEFYVLTGSRIDEYSNEDSYLNNGWLSFFFMDGLGNVGENNPNASFDYSYNADGYGSCGNEDGQIQFCEIYQYAHDTVYSYGVNEFGEVQTVQGTPQGSTWVFGTFGDSPTSPPQTPSTPDPANGETSVPIQKTLSWTSSGSTYADIYFGTASNPPLLVSNTTENPYNPGTLQPQTTYYWKIVAKNSDGSETGAIWHFTTETLSNYPPSAPITPVPANHTAGTARDLELGWQASTDPESDPIVYDVYLSTSSNPTTRIAQNLSTNAFTVNGLSTSTKYYWKVVAKDDHANQATSQTWDFTTGTTSNQPPSTPASPSPANGQADQETSLTLNWSDCTDPDSDPVRYDVYLSTSPTFSSPVKTGLSLSQTSVSGLSGQTTYYWKVVAKDNRGGQSSSATWSFTTRASGATSGTYRLVSVGISDYGGGSNDLDSPPYDSQDIRESLNHSNPAYQAQILSGEVSSSQVESVLSSIAAQAQPDDVLLFHYSGHGAYSSGQSNLIFSNGSYYPVSTLRQKLDAIDGTKIVLVDACESGGFVNLAVGRTQPILPATERLQLFNDAVLEAFAPSSGGGRGDFHSTYEYYVLTGSKVSEYSNEDSYLNNGWMTFFFNDGIGNVGQNNPNGSFDFSFSADGYGPNGSADGNITFSESYHYTHDKVLNYAQSEFGVVQTVQTNHSDASFVFYRTSQEVPTSPPTVPSSPNPANGASGVSLDPDLSWSASGATSYDLYFGTSANPSLRQSNLPSAIWDAGTLQPQTTYYWKIVAKNSEGNTTGPIWSFTTASSQPSTSPRVVLQSPTPLLEGGMQFHYEYASYDSVHPTPPHWVVSWEDWGWVSFQFSGKEDFNFHVRGNEDSWGDGTLIDVYVNGEYFGWTELFETWETWYISGDDLRDGINTVRIECNGWNDLWIDEAWA